MSSIRLPVVVCNWGSMWGLRDAFGLEWFCEANAEQAMNQIAAALNATAPGQAAEGQPCRHDTRHDTRTPEREQRLQSLGYEPAGEQRRNYGGVADQCACGHVRNWHALPNGACSVPICSCWKFRAPDPQPTEAAPSKLTREIGWAHGRVQVADDFDAPADPGEELRLLRLLERRYRTASSPDIDSAEDYVTHLNNGMGPVLDQLDALRAAGEGRS